MKTYYTPNFTGALAAATDYAAATGKWPPPPPAPEPPGLTISVPSD